MKEKFISCWIIVTLFLMVFPCLADNRVVVVPFVRETPVSGDAVPADVVEGKTFTSADGAHTGVRPPAPVGTDYISMYGNVSDPDSPIAGPGVKPPDPRFELYTYNTVVQNGYGVKDLMTGLIWTMSPYPVPKTFAFANNQCDQLRTHYQVGISRYLTADDWRLPTVREQESLLDYARGVAVNSYALVQPNYFTNIQDGNYWTSTISMVPCWPVGTRCNVVHVVDINSAVVNKQLIHPDQDPPPELYFWCVRGVYDMEY